MKKQKNLLYLLSIVLPCLFQITVQADPYAQNIHLQRPETFQYPENMQMPSVEDLFGNMTEEQIVQQIQEAQKLFESLSPEEMEEFAKIVDETWAKMPQTDKDAIQNIATMVKPYFPEEDESLKRSRQEEPIKKPKIIIQNNSVQDLIDNINAQINDVLQKISSNKDLVEEFTTKWASKVTLDNFKRNILTLKEDRLAHKLLSKANVEDKILNEALEKFYKNLADKNQQFFVEDTFGLPSSNKAQNAQQLKQTKDILSLFDDAFIDILPKIDEFLKKHAPEALEMAKEADERTKRAQAHAKDATQRRSSAQAPISPEPVRKQQATSNTSTNPNASYAPNYYDPYAYDNYGGYAPQPSYNYPSGNTQASTENNSHKPEEKKAEKKSEEKKDAKKEQEEKRKEATAYDEAVEILTDYVDSFTDKESEKLLKFLEKDLADYPRATDRAGNVTRPITQEEWLDSVNEFKNWTDSSGNFIAKGFRGYVDIVKDTFSLYTNKIEKLYPNCTEIERLVKKMSDTDLKKFADNKQLKNIQKRISDYIKALDDAYIAIRKQKEDNQNAVLTMLTDDYLTNYKKFHQDFERDLDDFKKILKKADDHLKEVFKRIKGTQRRNKKAAEKESEKTQINFF